MLLNPTTIHQRQRQHRRQKSTPAAFEAPKVPNLPIVQKNVSHRRGMSLDQRIRRQSPQQDVKQVSTTNTGFQQQQQILREAQQQRLARPGQQQTLNFNLTHDGNYLISPFVSPQKKNFDIECHNLYKGSRETLPLCSPYLDHANTVTKVGLNDCSEGDPYGGNDSIICPENGNITPSAYLDFSMALDDGNDQQDWGATIKPRTKPSSGRRVTGGIAGVAKFESMAAEQPNLRPVTPTAQNLGHYLPPTPDTTPFHRGCHDPTIEQASENFEYSYDTSMEATLKPIRRKGNQRARNIFQEMRENAEMNAHLPLTTALIPPSAARNSVRMPASNFMDMSNLNIDFMKNEEYDSPYYSPTASNNSPELSQHSSPEISQITLFTDPFSDKPDFEALNKSQYLSASRSSIDMHQAPSPMHCSPHNRSLSVDSIDLEETITETGITGEDIACYIDGPDPVDQKWLCLYPECRKRFGRKENIKSHVQTHLGDRQYQCPHCKKCFVRQHDLKRHAKIHSGVKPYPCICGNSFARHDALTRHRQRGMCIGAFEGVVKKAAKRGRPRKARPDIEERLGKASRTRSKNNAISSASSNSEFSDRPYARTPPGEFGVLDEKPFGNFTSDFSQTCTVMDGDSFQFSTEHSPMPTDCVSSQVIQNAPSPSALSTQSQNSHNSQDHISPRGSVTGIGMPQSQHLPSHPSSPAKSHRSYNPSSYNSPPELCLSSSPSLSSKFYDPSSQLDSHGTELSKFADFGLQSSNHEDDLFLNAFENSGMGLSQLEENPGLLLMGGKFDNAFEIVEQGDAGGEMFGDDIFFGSP